MFLLFSHRLAGSDARLQYVWQSQQCLLQRALTARLHVWPGLPHPKAAPTPPTRPQGTPVREPQEGRKGVWHHCEDDANTPVQIHCSFISLFYQYLHLYIHHLTWFCTFIYTLNNCKSINLIQMHVWWDVLRYISKLSLTQCILYHPTAIFQVDGRIRRGWFYSQFWHVFLISKILGTSACFVLYMGMPAGFCSLWTSPLTCSMLMSCLLVHV